MQQIKQAFISIDLEGMPHVVSGEHLSVDGKLYTEARKIATKITLATANTLKERGVEEVIVADSHGPMVNMLIEDLPSYMKVIRGSPRPISMVSGVKGCDIALFLGYHAKAGTTKSIFDHTYSGSTIDFFKVNDIELSEFLLNGFVAGHFDVPLFLVAGDKELIRTDVNEFTEHTLKVQLKSSFSRYAAMSPSITSVNNQIKKKIENRFNSMESSQGLGDILKLETPVNANIRFLNSSMADIADLLPIVSRKNGKEVSFEAKNIVEAYNIFQELVYAAVAVSNR